mmetsp:Transcript_25223/g.53324  ORF Transcript_25223/g.53324 Transcript_25223/m.53324 type:complete len:195 (+) Transcript_25223:132-716(+)
MEYERKNEEAARRQLSIQTKRLRSIQRKADEIQTLRSRKLKCLQIEVQTDAIRGGDDDGDDDQEDEGGGASANEKDDSLEKDWQLMNTNGNIAQHCFEATRPYYKYNHQYRPQHNNNNSPRESMIVRSQSMPAGTTQHWMKQTLHTHPTKTKKLQFTKRRSKSGPGEPSRPYYSVRMISQSEKMGSFREDDEGK